MGFNFGAFAGGAASGIERGTNLVAKKADADWKEKERTRQESYWKKDEEWKQTRSTYQTSAQKYLANMEAYNKAIAENPAAQVMPPAKPGLHDELKDVVELARIDVNYGKTDAANLMPLLKSVKQMEDEGLTTALQQLASGDRDGALRTFQSTGAIKDVSGIAFEDSVFTPGEGMEPIKSVAVVLPGGRRLDAVGALWAQQQAKDIINTTLRQQEAGDKRTTTQASIAHQKGTLAETTRHNKETEKKAKVSGGDTTAEIKNINYLLKNKIAKNQKEAWEMVRTGKTPGGDKVISDGLGGVIVTDPDGNITKFDSRGKSKVIRQSGVAIGQSSLDLNQFFNK